MRRSLGAWVLGLVIVGCGGAPGRGGDDGGSGKAAVKVPVNFAARTARVIGGESAQSVRLTFTNDAGDTTTTFDRSDSGYAEVSLDRGVYTLNAVFTAKAGGEGDVVGTASGRVNVAGNGVLDESLAYGTKVASVAIAPKATPALYPTVSPLGLEVRDAAGSLLAVRGDACSLIAGNEGSLQPLGGGFSALFEGTMSVRASVDGVASKAADVSTERSVVANGKVTPNYAPAVQLARWRRMPLSVRFARTGQYRSDLESRFREAMALWTGRTNNGVRFTDTSGDADIEISFVTQATLGDDTIGITYYSYEDTEEGRFHTKVRMQISSDYGTPAEVRYICAHELGHALGIEGHSPGPDLMYYRIGGIYNQRDVNTLRTAYGNDFSLSRSRALPGKPGSGVIVCPK